MAFCGGTKWDDWLFGFTVAGGFFLGYKAAQDNCGSQRRNVKSISWKISLAELPFFELAIKPWQEALFSESPVIRSFKRHARVRLPYLHTQEFFMDDRVMNALPELTRVRIRKDAIEQLLAIDTHSSVRQARRLSDPGGLKVSHRM